MSCGPIALTVFLSIVVIAVLCNIINDVCKRSKRRGKYNNTTNDSVHSSSMMGSEGVSRSYKSSSSYDSSYVSNSSSSYDYGDSSDSSSSSDCGSSDSGSSSCD